MPSVPYNMTLDRLVTYDPVITIYQNQSQSAVVDLSGVTVAWRFTPESQAGTPPQTPVVLTSEITVQGPQGKLTVNLPPATLQTWQWKRAKHKLLITFPSGKTVKYLFGVVTLE